MQNGCYQRLNDFSMALNHFSVPLNDFSPLLNHFTLRFNDFSMPPSHFTTLLNRCYQLLSDFLLLQIISSL